MENKENNKRVFLIILLVAVLSLAIGFAGWNATLQITNATANVSAGNNDAGFSSKIKVSSISCSKENDGVVVSTGTLDTSNHTWSDIVASLTKTGDSVTCSASIVNDSDYTAYIKSVNIASGGISCSSSGEGNIDEACDSLELTVTAHGSKDSTASLMGGTYSNLTGITSNPILSNASGLITFKIDYKGTGVADTDFIAYIPSISFELNSVD